jgi:nucleoid DNA-binding protein
MPKKNPNVLFQKELIRKTAVNTGIDKEAVAEIFKESINLIKEAISNGKEVKIPWFGNFEVRTRKPKHAYNMNKREKIIIPERNALFFIPSKAYWDPIKFKKFPHLQKNQTPQKEQ